MDQQYMTKSQDEVRNIFVVGLRNAHALENQALTLMDRQVERMAEYVDVEARLRSHRGETERQIERLEQILEDLGESHSSLKDAAMSFTGNISAIGNMFADDEIIKNSFANYAFENYECATYRALIVMADQCGADRAIPLLRESLREEEAMVSFLDDMLPKVVMRYLTLTAAGHQASR